MAKVTLKDIANRAGVSVALVSSYLNKKPNARMTNETKQKIDTAIAQLDYRGSAIARSLRTGKSYIIGYVAKSMRTEIAQNELMAVMAAAEEENYQVFATFNTSYEKTLSSIQMLIARGCDGIILSGSFDQEFSTYICQNFKPVFILNVHPNVTIPGMMIRYDYRSTIGDIITYLREKNHKNIFYQTYFEHAVDQRYLEFVKLCGENNVWQISNPTVDDLQKFYRDNPDCTAMLHLNDFIAMQTIQLCNKLSINVPHDLAIVGWDNVKAASCYTPSLSSVQKPLDLAAFYAIKSLLNQINGNTAEIPETLPCKFIARESIGM
jgi:DNA-binding LacI/PurR family transcriptional regulator